MKSGFVGLRCGEFCSRGSWSVFMGGMEPEVFSCISGEGKCVPRHLQFMHLSVIVF